MQNFNKLLFNLFAMFATMIKNLNSNFKLIPDKLLSASMQCNNILLNLHKLKTKYFAKQLSFTIQLDHEEVGILLKILL